MLGGVRTSHVGARMHVATAVAACCMLLLLPRPRRGPTSGWLQSLFSCELVHLILHVCRARGDACPTCRRGRRRPGWRQPGLPTVAQAVQGTRGQQRQQQRPGWRGCISSWHGPGCQDAATRGRGRAAAAAAGRPPTHALHGGGGCGTGAAHAAAARPPAGAAAGEHLASSCCPICSARIRGAQACCCCTPHMQRAAALRLSLPVSLDCPSPLVRLVTAHPVLLYRAVLRTVASCEGLRPWPAEHVTWEHMVGVRSGLHRDQVCTGLHRS